MCVDVNAYALSEVGALFHRSEFDPRTELCAQLAATLTKLAHCLFGLCAVRGPTAGLEATARGDLEAEAENSCARLARLIGTTRLLLGVDRALRFLRSQSRLPRYMSLEPACRIYVPEGSALERVGATLEAGFGRLRLFLARDPLATTQLVLEPYESARLGVKFHLWLLALGPSPTAEYEYGVYRLSRLDLSRRSRLLTRLCSESLGLPVASSTNPPTALLPPIAKENLPQQLFLVTNWPAFQAIASLIGEVEERLLMNSLHQEVLTT